MKVTVYTLEYDEGYFSHLMGVFGSPQEALERAIELEDDDDLSISHTNEDGEIIIPLADLCYTVTPFEVEVKNG